MLCSGFWWFLFLKTQFWGGHVWRVNSRWVFLILHFSPPNSPPTPGVDIFLSSLSRLFQIFVHKNYERYLGIMLQLVKFYWQVLALSNLICSHLQQCYFHDCICVFRWNFFWGEEGRGQILCWNLGNILYLTQTAFVLWSGSKRVVNFPWESLQRRREKYSRNFSLSLWEIKRQKKKISSFQKQCLQLRK